MQRQQPSQVNKIQLWTPQCSKCGSLTALARIEPGDDANHDLRTFECEHCGHMEAVKIKFR